MSHARWCRKDTECHIKLRMLVSPIKSRGRAGEERVTLEAAFALGEQNPKGVEKASQDTKKDKIGKLQGEIPEKERSPWEEYGV